MYGQTRLADYYEGRLSLRELGNRFYSLPPEAPIWAIWEAERAKAEARQQVAEVDDVLAPFKR